jgi:hypothetical protein
MRDRIKKRAGELNIPNCDVWSGQEFEEFLRKNAESLLRRFVEGEEFPDSPSELKSFGETTSGLSDEEALAYLPRLFDRPAFYTPMQQESNLGDFRQALTDTIQALGTGRWKARDGALIARVPSRHEFRSESLRTRVREVEMALARLRSKFDEHQKSGAIRRCDCGKPECQTYFMQPNTARELEELRRSALDLFGDIHPEFGRRTSW